MTTPTKPERLPKAETTNTANPQHSLRAGDAILQVLAAVALATMITFCLSSLDNPIKRLLGELSLGEPSAPVVGVFLIPGYLDGTYPTPSDQLAQIVDVINRAPSDVLALDAVIMNDVPVEPIELLWAAVVAGCERGKHFVFPFDIDGAHSKLNQYEPSLDAVSESNRCWTWAELNPAEPTRLDTGNQWPPSIARAAAEAHLGSKGQLRVALKGQTARTYPAQSFDVAYEVSQIDRSTEILVISTAHQQLNREVTDAIVIDGDATLGVVVVASLIHTLLTAEPIVIEQVPNWSKTALEMVIAGLALALVVFRREVQPSWSASGVVVVWLVSFYATGWYFSPLGILLALYIERPLNARMSDSLGKLKDSTRLLASITTAVLLVVILIYDASHIPGTPENDHPIPTASPIGSAPHWLTPSLTQTQHEELWADVLEAMQQTVMQGECSRFQYNRGRVERPKKTGRKPGSDQS